MSEPGPVVVTGPDDPNDAPAPGDDLVAFRSAERSLWGRGVALRIELPAPWTDHVGVVGLVLADLDGKVREVFQAGEAALPAELAGGVSASLLPEGGRVTVEAPLPADFEALKAAAHL